MLQPWPGSQHEVHLAAEQLAQRSVLERLAPPRKGGNQVTYLGAARATCVLDAAD